MTIFCEAYWKLTYLKVAPGKVSITSDGWTADNTKGAFMGVTAHWIDIEEGKWKLHAEVMAFRALSGDHGGENLGRYMVGLCDHVGITSQTESKVN